ncbi:MAG: hypothetical protein UIL37_05370 [Clostridia bacterium]|nr:hypothetical protein [Clostridia bacterium]
MNDIKFFLGANSEKGFTSYFKQLQEQYSDLQLIVLKGGPGSGKSSLMKRIAKMAQRKGHNVELIPCASDPHSLDAFIDKTAMFAMLDGTAPHVEDPVLPGAVQHIAYTGSFWDTKLLRKNRYDIAYLNEKISDCHRSATAYIKAAAALMRENMSIAKRSIKYSDVYALAQEIVSKFPTGHNAKVSKRLLSAVSVGEICFFEETLTNLADKTYVIEDKWGAASDYLLKTVMEGAIGHGVDVICCPCSIIPDRIEHIIIPSEKIAISASNLSHTAGCACAMIDGLYGAIEDLPVMEKRLGDSKVLLEEACGAVARAKKLHDELEVYYVNAMDFSRLDEVYDKIIKTYY